MKKFLPLLLIFQSCIGWGDMFAKLKQITGNYYLVESDNGFFNISYKVDGGYIGRNPAYSQVIAYAYIDMVLVMKVKPYQGETFYYAIDMNKDSEVAKQEDYEMDKIAEKDYKN